MMVEKHVYISGIVQGVYFRDYTRREAEKLGVKGWVRNLPDGRVEAVFAGPAEAVEKIIAWCHQGSPSAHVTGVEVTNNVPAKDFNDFKITG
ncbi:acylphosphatase [Desulfoscipio geothermicus]|uniref:Acylphosphatase n=1 Tax=Desulfoscipio geothermicus DSM 3669 TaxID=1121426 RepID=A0A1I6D6B9_9FIRM|nr:acylphosphatase [Desulfoscipio geothermicus]SFR00901.1 acylphosphatase [Desulfoscipio geothermicus DSM 3669]